MRKMTLCLIHQSPKILLAMKKIGFGKGRWNGFGGKVLPEETIEECLVREGQEELNIIVKDFEKRAIFQFHFPHDPKIDCEVHVFKANSFSGELKESEEMKPKWFNEKDIPYDKMWSDDKLWLPLFLQDKKLKAEFYFDNNDNIVNYSLNEVENL